MAEGLNKKVLVEQIQAHLLEELQSTDSGERAQEIQQQLTMYRFLPLREYGDEDVACPASLVELDFNGKHAFYFIVPKGGGLVTSVDGNAVQVVTPQSPVGAAVLGKRVGETVEVDARGGTRRYRVVSIR